MSLDRFITLNLIRPLLQVRDRPRSSVLRLPVLMYHSVSNRDESHFPDYYKVCTPPAQFRLQMQTLKEHGYLGVDLETGLDWLNAPPSSPLRTIERVGRRDGESKPTVFVPWTLEPGSRRGDEAEGAKVQSAPPPHVSGYEQEVDGKGRGEVQDSPSRLPPPAFSRVQPVAITFDDGFRDFFTEAMPVLSEHGFTATMYLPTAFIHTQRRKFKETDCLTWSEVIEGNERGMRFGSHTVHHPKLYELPWPEIEAELRESRAELEDRLGQLVHSFAYPYAFPEADRDFCGRLRDTLIRGGYRSCVTTIAGRVTKGDDAHTLRRLPMNVADDAALLLAKLEGAYDWMEPAQQTFKRVKRLLSRGTGRTEVPNSVITNNSR